MKLLFKKMKTFTTLSEVTLSPSLFFHGSSLDDRGEAALSLLPICAVQNYHLYYDKTTTLMHINTTPHNIRKDFKNYIKSLKGSHAIIETTTLGFAEILLLLNTLAENPSIQTIDFLYIEPKEYTIKENKLYSYHDFALSDGFTDFGPIHGYTIERDEPVELIAFLGFERTRLGQLLQSSEAEYNKLSPVVPLPAFVLGWENRTINNHLYYFTTQYSYHKLYYAGANNPYHAYTLLDDISKNNRPFRIAPIGTKPNAIGCAVFLVNNKDLNFDVIYDYPEKSSGRSSGIGNINLYTLVKERN